jgi:hypothetical protein
VCVCLFVGMHHKIKCCFKRNYSKIISNISAYISPIRLRNIAGDLAGARVTVSGWGKTSDSKYSFLIISHFNLKNCTYQNDCFKGEVSHGLQKTFWLLWITSIYTVACRVYGPCKDMWQCYMNQTTFVIYTLNCIISWINFIQFAP